MAKQATKRASQPRSRTHQSRPARKRISSRASRPDDPIDGIRLRQRREALGLSQPQLGNLVDTPLNTISRWERGAILIDHPDWLDEQMKRLEKDCAENGPIAKPPAIDGERLQKRREALGLTHAELGALLDTPPSTIVRWERGKISIGSPSWLSWRLDTLEEAAAQRVAS